MELSAMDSQFDPRMVGNVTKQQPQAPAHIPKKSQSRLPTTSLSEADGNPPPHRMAGITFVDQSTTLGRRASAPSRFRRPHTGRACVTCHTRKVRCDAATLGTPCTNCIAFFTECKVPKSNWKPTGGKSTHNPRHQGNGPTPRDWSTASIKGHTGSTSDLSCDKQSTFLTQPNLEENSEDNEYYLRLVKKEDCDAPIVEAGRVAYLDEASFMTLLVNAQENPSGAVHYPIHKPGELMSPSLPQIDKFELQLLDRRGALSLPPPEVAEDLIKTYFKWVAPVMPIINKTRFMQQYRDPDNPPSLLLRQAVFLAASRACTNPQLMDSSGSTIPAATTFYQRAKALYESCYETDRVAIVQALILMGWYWEEKGKVTKNVFYWNGLAVTIAQGCGMHRNADGSRLSAADKRLWKRIWWTLFTRDRSVAIAMGRPTHINTALSSVDMLTEEDFIDDDDTQFSVVLPSRVKVQFFLQYVKICQVMDLVLLQYSLPLKAPQRDALGLTECDMALADWLQNCPQELRWEQSRHNFWSALLCSAYHTTSILLHRKYLPPAPVRRKIRNDVRPDRPIAPLRSPAFQAAHAITSIMKAMSDHNELRYAPPFFVFSINISLLILVYQLYVAMPIADVAAKNRVRICMACLDQIGKIWLVARMVRDLYKTILSQKGLAHALHDGPGKIHDSSEPKKVSVLTQHKDVGVPDSSGESDAKTKLKSQNLTPALLAYLFAALNTATSSPGAENDDSSKDDAEDNENTPGQQEASQSMKLISRETHDSRFLSNFQSHQSTHQQFMDQQKSDHVVAQPPANMQTPRYVPQQSPAYQNPETYTEVPVMAVSDPSIQGFQMPQNQDFMRNTVDHPQFFPADVGQFQPSYAFDDLSLPPTELYYTSMYTPMIPPPASTGPNLMEWIQYFGIGNYQEQL